MRLLDVQIIVPDVPNRVQVHAVRGVVNGDDYQFCIRDIKPGIPRPLVTCNPISERPDPMRTTSRSRARRSKALKLFIAVVVNMTTNLDHAVIHSLRNRGDWASFVGTDRDAVIEEAVESCHAWSAPGGNGYGHKYRVLVGELTGAAVTPTRFEVVPLS